MKAVGIDGCRFGWISACYENQQILVFKTIRDLVSHYSECKRLLIDIPIGLASANCPDRTCEKEARALLPSTRKSTVFPVPCRESLQATSFAEANEINRKILGCGISKQTWFIIPKIKEVDSLVIENRQIRSRLKESHPEIVFQFLNRECHLFHKKKTKAGQDERLNILMKYEKNSEAMFHKAMNDYRRAQVAKDDILDAMCLAIVARDPDLALDSIPANSSKDEFGIEMAIFYRSIDVQPL